MVYGSFAKGKLEGEFKRHYLGTQLSYDVAVRPEIACVALPRCWNYGSAAEFSECDPLVCLLSSGYILLSLPHS